MSGLLSGVARGLLISRNKITYLFRDGAANAVVATPDTLGRHTVVTTDGTFTKTGGRLVFTVQTTPTWGDQGIIMLPAVDASFTRANGLALFSTLNLTTWEEHGIGWHTAAAVVDPDSMETAIQANTTDGRLDDENGESIYTGLSLSTDYKIAQVLRATGDFTFLHDGTNWLLIRISDVGATSAVYPVLANLDGAGNYDLREATQLPASHIPRPVVSDSFSLIPTIADSGSNGLDATPVRVGLSGSAASFDGANSVADIYSAALNTAFDTDNGMMFIRMKVPSDVAYANNTGATTFAVIQADGSNFVRFKGNTAGQVLLQYDAGGTLENLTYSSLTTTDWQTFNLIWDTGVADEIRGYRDGGDEKSSATLGVWAGALSANDCVVAASNNTPTNAAEILVSDFIVGFGTSPSAAQAATIDTKTDAGTLTTTDLDTIFGAGNWAWWKLNEQYASDGLGHLEADGNGSGKTRLGGTWSNAGSKRYNAPLGGDEVIVNGGMDADTDWDKGTGWAIAAGVATKTAGTGSDLGQTVDPLTAGEWCRLTHTVANRTAGTVTPKFGTEPGIARSTNDTFTETQKANAAAFDLTADATFDGDEDDVTVQQLALADLLGLVQYANTDVYLRDDLTITDGYQAGIGARWDSQTSPANGIEIVCDRGSTEQIVVGKYVAGTYTEVSATAFTYSAGATLEVRCIGNEVWVSYNKAHVVTDTISDAGIISNTLNGLFGTENATTHENDRDYATGAINLSRYFVGA